MSEKKSASIKFLILGLASALVLTILLATIYVMPFSGSSERYTFKSIMLKNISLNKAVSLDSPQRKEIPWDYAYECAEHGFNGAIDLTKAYGKYNLTPYYDAKKGPSDWLYPALLPASLSMYKITRDKIYLDCARSTALGIERCMLNDKGIITMYSRKNGPSNTQPTNFNNYLLPSIAELAIYDPSFSPLAEKVAGGIINFGLSPKDLPYGSIYPSGIPAELDNGIPSNGGNEGSVSITIIGLLRTYEATGNTTYLKKGRDILVSLWHNERTKQDLIPTIFDSTKSEIVRNDTQLYATGELLRAYIYYYYLTHDQNIKDIISAYSSAAYSDYWRKTADGQGYFVYRVNVKTGKPASWILETNWHKLDMSLIYAGEIIGRNYTDRAYQDMNTFWLVGGLSYKNHLFRHGTNFNGSPAVNRQSLIYASMRTAIYMMLRMLNNGAFKPSDSEWNDKVWDHVNATRCYHYYKYGYYSAVSVETLKPDPKYYGLPIEPACGEFASLVTLMFHTTPNIKMVWESFPFGDYVLEPFPVSYYADDIGFMRGVFMDRSHKEIAFKNIISKGEGKIYCVQPIDEVIMDGLKYTKWHDDAINATPGNHEYIIIFKGGSYISPKYSRRS